MHGVGEQMNLCTIRRCGNRNLFVYQCLYGCFHLQNKRSQIKIRVSLWLCAGNNHIHFWNMICWNQGKSVRRLAFYQPLRLKGHHICRKGCSQNDTHLMGVLCALENSCLQVWAGKLIVAQSDYKCLTAKPEHLLPENAMRWRSYSSSKVRSPCARLSVSMNPCTITQWREWNYTNLHWHSIWLLGAWDAEVLRSLSPVHLHAACWVPVMSELL